MFTRLACALLVSAAVAAPAIAQTSDPVTARIEVADLDLAKSKDRVRLSNRIRSAAQEICRFGTSGLAALAFERQCVETALASASPQVGLAIAKASSAVQIAAVTPSRGG